MPLDPEIQSLIARLTSEPSRPMHTMTASQARRYKSMLAAGLAPSRPTIKLADIHDIEIPLRDHHIPARIYRPHQPPAASGQATILFLHGGGHTLGSVESADPLCRELARATGSVVLSLGYRLAPEFPFPAAVDDSFHGALWACEHIDELGGTRDLMCLAGDSSGGNLAAVTTIQLRDAGERVHAQLLLYPETDFERENYESRRRYTSGYLLDSDELDWFSDNYLPAGIDRSQPRVSPINADLTDLPPTLIVTAEYDPLRDEAELFAARLSDAGNTVSVIRFPGLVHAFANLTAVSEASASAIQRTFTEFAMLIYRDGALS